MNESKQARRHDELIAELLDSRAPKTEREHAAVREKAKPDPLTDIPPKIDPGVGAGESRTVTLRSGGTLTISASAGWLSLSADDRKFVFGLIDELTAYEKKSATDDNDLV